MPTAKEKAATVAKEKTEATEPKVRLSKIERLKRDLAEAEAAERAKLDTKVAVAKETLRIAVNAVARAQAKFNKATEELVDLGLSYAEVDKLAESMAPAAAAEANAEPETTEG